MNEDDGIHKHIFRPPVDVDVVPKHIEETAEASEKLANQLARFPAKPRGKLPGREKAAGIAAGILAAQGGGVIGLEAATAKLKRLSNKCNYEPAGDSTANRRKLQVGKAFVWDHADTRIPQMLDRVQAKYGEPAAGRGNRTDLSTITAFIRALLEIEDQGLPSPVATILPAHMQVRAFVDALVEARYLRADEVTALQNGQRKTRIRLNEVHRKVLPKLRQAAEKIA